MDSWADWRCHYLLCRYALALNGKDNKKLGKYGVMDSACDHMDARRFAWSALLALVGLVLIFLGTTAMAAQLMEKAPRLGQTFWILCLFGVSAADLITH